jgi:hypothetical protein
MAISIKNNTAYTYNVHDIREVTDEITSLNHRYLFNCSSCGLCLTNGADIIGCFLSSNKDYKNIYRLTISLMCSKCDIRYNLTVYLNLSKHYNIVHTFKSY